LLEQSVELIQTSFATGCHLHTRNYYRKSRITF